MEAEGNGATVSNAISQCVYVVLPRIITFTIIPQWCLVLKYWSLVWPHPEATLWNPCYHNVVIPLYFMHCTGIHTSLFLWFV